MKRKLSRTSIFILSLLMMINSFSAVPVFAEEEEILDDTEEITEVSEIEETENSEESSIEESELENEVDESSEDELMNISHNDEIEVYASSEDDKTPYVEYDFNNNLTDLQGHAVLTAWSSVGSDNRSNSSTSFGSDKTNGSYWQWHSNTARGGGFYIDIDKNIGDEYTIGLKFSFEVIDGSWKKIIDYKNSTSDTGFYFYTGNHLNFYNYGVNGASVTNSNQVVDMIVRRNRTTKEFEAYIVNNGTAYLDMSVSDSGDQGVPAVINGKTRLGFFFDDIATTSEATPGGKVYNLKIWDSYMDPKDVIEALKPGGTVIAHYIDEDGDEVLPDVKVSGFIGDTYEVKSQEVYGYEYLRSEGAATSGTLPDNGSITVKFIYKCLIPYTVTARYVDESGNKLCEDILYKGEEGKTYQLHQLEIEDYDFVRVEGDETGTYTKKPKLVTYVYKKEEIPPVLEESTVYASYVDEEGNKLISDAIYKGYIDNPYQTSQLTIPGYEIKQVNGSAVGVYTKDPIQVEYVYTKKETEEDLGGTVLVHYKDTQGYTISADALFEGQIGDLYAAEKKEFTKYKFDKVIGSEKGEIKQEIQVVTIVYAPLASNVLARYVDENDLTIADAEVYSGGIGHQYSTQKKEIAGYKLIKIEGNEKGVFSEHVQVVKYVYGQIGNIHVNYLDLDGKKIHESNNYTDFVGKDYKTKALDIYSYELVRVEGNEEGKYQVGDQTINYIYEKIIVGDVNVHYLDESGNKIEEDKLLFGRLNSPYQVEIPQFHGYELIKTEGNLSGNYAEKAQEVTLIYRLTMPKTVTARYVDEDGNLLCSDIVYKGNLGTLYKTSQLEIKNYDFVEVIGNVSGFFTREPQLVTYVYKKKENQVELGKVLAKYVDVDGVELHSDLVYKGQIGNSYKTSPLTMLGYELKEVVGIEQSTFKSEEQIVTYIYEEKENVDPIGGTVLVKYETEEGITIHEDNIINGLIGDPYQVEQLELSGYTFKRMEGPFYDHAFFRLARNIESEGEIEEFIKVIHLIYEPVDKEKVPATTVIAKYVDKDGNLIHFDQIYNGLVGDEYKTEQVAIDGYELIRVEGEESGYFNEEVQLVTYVYGKLGKVVITITDEEGNVIKEVIITGVIGEEIKVDDIEIDGYEHIRGEINGVFSENQKEVTFVYKDLNKKQESTDNSSVPVVNTADESNRLFYFGWMLISFIAMIQLKRRLKSR